MNEETEIRFEERGVEDITILHDDEEHLLDILGDLIELYGLEVLEFIFAVIVVHHGHKIIMSKGFHVSEVIL